MEMGVRALCPQRFDPIKASSHTGPSMDLQPGGGERSDRPGTPSHPWC